MMCCMHMYATMPGLAAPPRGVAAPVQDGSFAGDEVTAALLRLLASDSNKVRCRLRVQPAFHVSKASIRRQPMAATFGSIVAQS